MRACDRPDWQPSRRRLVWPNGTVAQAFSSEDPEALRGPQFAAAWADELAKWRHAEATWDMLQFGLRLGARPRQVVTTTPRPMPLLKRLIAARRHGRHPRDARATTRRTSRRASSSRVVGRYAGTRLGRQELLGELIEDRADALWLRADIEAAARRERRRRSGRIVVAVDPPASQRSGICGIVAAGLGEDGIGYVRRRRRRVERGAAGRMGGARRSRSTAALDADALVAEVNQGGDMVEAVHPRGRRRRAGDAGAGDARQVAPRRAGRRALRAGARPPRRRAAGTRGRDGRLRPRRALRRPLARPARRAGLGDHRADARGRAASRGCGGCEAARECWPFHIALECGALCAAGACGRPPGR